MEKIRKEEVIYYPHLLTTWFYTQKVCEPIQNTSEADTLKMVMIILTENVK